MPLKRRTVSTQKRSDKTQSGIVTLIDLDIVLYQAASVSDKVSYTCCGSPAFQYKKDMVYYCHANDLPVDMIEKHINPEPLSYCLHTIKQMIHGIMDATGANTMRGFLTGKDNYREQIDSRFPYKGHRDPKKPTHFYAARGYLISYFDAEVIDGMEADDAMGIAQYHAWTKNGGMNDDAFMQGNSGTIICTTDKDLNMIPGWHYNWQKDEKYWVDQDEADLFFYKQLLTGDNVDNIKGIKGIGPKKAEKILEALKEDDTYTLKGMYSECLYQYESAGMNYYDLLENANLLWIQRERGVLWTPPK